MARVYGIRIARREVERRFKASTRSPSSRGIDDIDPHCHFDGHDELGDSTAHELEAQQQSGDYTDSDDPEVE